MKRGLAALSLVGCLVAGVLAAAAVTVAPSAGAQNGTDTGTTGTTATTVTTTTSTATASPTPTVPRPTTIPAGVTIARILVGGLSPAAAKAEVQAVFRRPLVLRVGTRVMKVTPQQLGAASYLGSAVDQARRTPPGRNVPLKVSVNRAKVARYVQTLADRFDRDAVDARLLLRGVAPFVTKDAPGRALKQKDAVKAIVLALKTHDRSPQRLGFERVDAAVTRASIGDVIVIRRGSNQLHLYDGMKPVRNFGVATGQPAYPTPLGRFEIVVKWRNPWWYPPKSDWAKDAKPIPPGPGNPLGTRWMGISSPAVGIHGTPDAASIGYSASHGCIRMRIPEVEWLFEQVDIGTPVFIVSA